MDALGNFLTETGAQGVFQESLTPQNTAADFPEPVIEEYSKPIFRKISAAKKESLLCKKYIDSLMKYSLTLRNHRLQPKSSVTRTGANNGKNILSPYG